MVTPHIFLTGNKFGISKQPKLSVLKWHASTFSEIDVIMGIRFKLNLRFCSLQAVLKHIVLV